MVLIIALNIKEDGTYFTPILKKVLRYSYSLVNTWLPANVLLKEIILSTCAAKISLIFSDLATLYNYSYVSLAYLGIVLSIA
jgi:hypothetical protein